MVMIETSMGNIKVELYKDKAPISVENFLSYVKDGYYDDTVFHRVIPGFVIQAGGWDTSMKPKPQKPPIENEAKNGLLNETGTLSVARTNDINSGTTHFFINLTHNTSLDHHGERSYGYAVFGKVTDGMDVVNKIAAVKTGRGDAPVEQVVIKSMKVVK